MFSVVHPYRFGVGLSLHCFSSGFPNRRAQRDYRHDRAKQPASEYYVEDFTYFHASRVVY